MEFILRDDQKKQQDPAARDRESALGRPFPLETPEETTATASADVRSDLVALMRAVDGQRSAVEAPLGRAPIAGAPPRGRGDDGQEGVESNAEYNREDAGVK